ncbi:MAG TPA: PIG-L family deacetylase [bacterium]|nr:PIG-L family deacetylase [bacterium]
MKRSAILSASALALLLLSCSASAGQVPPLPSFLTDPGRETGRECVMFIFGHFDDDSVIAGTINMYLRAGWEAHEVWVTSAGMGEGSMWGSVTERYAEMERVADIQGLPPEGRHVLNVPDRRAVEHLPEIVDSVTELVKKHRPSVIVTAAYEGGHWDHDASCLAGWVASQRVDFPVARFEVPTYNASGPRLMPFRMNGFIKSYGPWEHVKLDREAWAMRKKVRYGYQSQWFLMWPEGILGTWRHLRGQGEPIRRTPDYDFLSPPHPGTLMVQNKTVGALPGRPFSDWQDGVRQIPEFQSQQ